MNTLPSDVVFLIFNLCETYEVLAWQFVSKLFRSAATRSFKRAISLVGYQRRLVQKCAQDGSLALLRFYHDRLRFPIYDATDVYDAATHSARLRVMFHIVENRNAQRLKDHTNASVDAHVVHPVLLSLLYPNNNNNNNNINNNTSQTNTDYTNNNNKNSNLMNKNDDNPSSVRSFVADFAKKTFDSVRHPVHRFSILHAAALVGNMEILKLVLEKSPLGKKQQQVIASTDAYGFTPLCYACLCEEKERRFNAVKLLLDYGAAVDARVSHLSPTGCNSALDIAAIQGDAELVRLLLETHIRRSPNHFVELRTNALRCAADYGHLPVAKALYADSNVFTSLSNQKETSNSTTSSSSSSSSPPSFSPSPSSSSIPNRLEVDSACIHAVSGGHMHMLKFLCEKWNALSSGSPLVCRVLLAAANSYSHMNTPSIMKYLLSLKVFDAMMLSGLVHDALISRTALHAACMNFDVEIVRLLLEAGADPLLEIRQNAPGRGHRATWLNGNALHISLEQFAVRKEQFNAQIETIRTVVQHCPMIVLIPKSSSGDSPLHVLLKQKSQHIRTKLVRELIALNTSLTHQNEKKKLALELIENDQSKKMQKIRVMILEAIERQKKQQNRQSNEK